MTSMRGTARKVPRVRLRIALGISAAFLAVALFLFVVGNDSTLPGLIAGVFGPIATASWYRLRTKAHD